VFEYEGSQYSIEPFDVDSKPGEDNYHKLHSIKKMNKTGNVTAICIRRSYLLFD